MIGVDTNVLVRYFVNDDAVQHTLARRLIDSNDIFISNLVLAESYWVFKSLYKLDKEKIESIFFSFLQMSNIEFENDVVFSHALTAYQEINCDFGDAIIAAVHSRNGIDTASFDRSAIKKLGFRDPAEILG